MKRPVIMMAAIGLMLALMSPLASAHTVGTVEPVTVAQDEKADKAKEEYEAYIKYYNAYQEKKIPEAIKLAKAYLEKFPEGQYAAALKTWVTSPGVRAFEFEEARKAKNTNEMIRIAREALAEDPENLDYIYLLAVHIRQNHMSPQAFSFTSEAREFTEKAIKLIEGGKIPNVVKKEDWKQNTILSYFNETLAKLEENNRNADKALEYYAKAASLDPTKPANFFDCGRLHQIKYVKAVEEYNKFSEEDRSAPEDQIKPEVKAAFDEVNRQVDKVIECWARFMAVSATSDGWAPTREKVGGELTKLYNYRHPDNPDGLQKLIEQYRTGAPSASAGDTNASTKP